MKHNKYLIYSLTQDGKIVENVVYAFNKKEALLKGEKCLHNIYPDAFIISVNNIIERKACNV